MGSYYNIDAILTDAQKVPCTFTLDLPNMGYLDDNAGGDVLLPTTLVPLPPPLTIHPTDQSTDFDPPPPLAVHPAGRPASWTFASPALYPRSSTINISTRIECVEGGSEDGRSKKSGRKLL